MSGPRQASIELPSEVDGIFVGGGHNSLIAAGYLARAGLSVLVLEEAPSIGGGVATVELTLPFFKHNPHAYFVRWTEEYNIWKDLELSRFGVRTIVPDAQYGLAYDGGRRALVLSRGLPETLESVARLSPRDAEAYERLFPEWRDLLTGIIGPMYFSPPLDPALEQELLEKSDLGRKYLAYRDQSALEVVQGWFEAPPMQALGAFVGSVRGYLSVMDVPGTGYLPPLALFTAHAGSLVEGGSFEVLRAIAAALHAAGGIVAASCGVTSIDVSSGRARGVTTTDGRTVTARKFVASSVPAPLTLLELVGRSHLDASLAADLERYHWRDEGLFGAHYALREAPELTAATDDPAIARSLNLALGLESLDVLEEHITALRESREPGHSVLHAAVPTVHDPSQAPEGFHTAFSWEEVPVRAADGSQLPWDREASDRHAGRMRETWERYAPGFSERVLATATVSSTDSEVENRAMRFGDWHHGSYHPDNYGWNRPHTALSSYRTPIDGLYLCGSSQHPGGSFSGGPGFNAAGVIADDLGVEVWWQRPPLTAILRSHIAA